MNSKLDRSTAIFIIISALFAVGMFTATKIIPSTTTPILFIWFFLILICEIAADIFPIVYFGFGNAQTEVSVSLGITFSVACICPPSQAILLAIIEIMASDIITHKSLDKIIFNAALYTTVIGGTSLIFHHFSLSQQGPSQGINLLAVALAALYYIISESTLLSILFSIISKKPFWGIFTSFFKQSFIVYISLLPLGIVITELFKRNSLNILFLIPTFLFLYFSLKREQALRNQTETVLEKLVDILESKSLETAQHSRRVRGWVEDMCNELGMETGEQDILVQAAILHDLGKVGITDELLTKPEKLSDEEFNRIKKHPSFSAQILEGLTLFKSGREIVLHHHERYDGKGYPDHLAGENIPLGSRIITVADSFDAMVSTRSYRAKNRTVMETLKVLDDCSGTQFDPRLITVFKKVVMNCLETKNMKNFPTDIQIGSEAPSPPPNPVVPSPSPILVNTASPAIIAIPLAASDKK